MGERLLCKQEVIGSIPFTSTTVAAKLQRRAAAALARRERAALMQATSLSCRNDREGPSLPCRAHVSGRRWSAPPGAGESVCCLTG